MDIFKLITSVMDFNRSTFLSEYYKRVEELQKELSTRNLKADELFNVIKAIQTENLGVLNYKIKNCEHAV
jgi:hypothetical protein